MNHTIKTLLDHYKKISYLQSIKSLLDWDLNVSLPKKAVEDRALQSAELERIIVNCWKERTFRNHLEIAQKDKKNYPEKQRAMIRNLLWASQYYYKVPEEIILEFTKTTSEAFMAWSQARQENSFSLFLPYLKRIIRLNQIIAQHLGYKDNPYDALLHLYEPYLTTKKLKEIFDILVPELKTVVHTVQKSTAYVKNPPFVGKNYYFSTSDQKKLALFIIKKMGYDMTKGRLDLSPHPFTQALSPFDVRITSRFNVHDLRAYTAACIHEAGHALYEQGVLPSYSRTPLEHGVSLGIHESQSRFWENMVGRNSVFLTYLTPTICAFFPDVFDKADYKDIVVMYNHVRPSTIRVEADEVTYNLHIALRFELEEALINNKIKVKNLPEIWREKMRQYLDIVPKTDAEGVLQDVHWSYGVFGYFPTYTLGNLYAGQFLSALKEELSFTTILSKGELGTIFSWLKDKIYQHGSLYWPDELIKKVTHKKLDPSYFLSYIKEKYRAIYPS